MTEAIIVDIMFAVFMVFVSAATIFAAVVIIRDIVGHFLFEKKVMHSLRDKRSSHTKWFMPLMK